MDIYSLINPVIVSNAVGAVLALALLIVVIVFRKQVGNWLRNRNWTIIRHHLARGTWISIAWNWCLINVGRAAEGYLTLSVLYQSASLLPGVSTLPAVDNAIFIVQQLALDIGGIALAKQSQRTRSEGHHRQANIELGVGFTLMGLMVINSIVYILQHLKVFGPEAVIVIEALLLGLRSIMAIIYGYVVFSPRDMEDLTVVPTSTVKERLDGYEQQLTTVVQSVSQLNQMVQSWQQTVQSEVHQLVQSVVHAQATMIIEEVQGVVRSQLLQVVQPELQLVHTQVQEVVHSLPLQVEAVVLEQVQPLIQQQVQTVVQMIENDDNSEALKSLAERLQEVSLSVSEMRTTITEVRTVTQKTERSAGVRAALKGGSRQTLEPENEPAEVVHSTAKVYEDEPVDVRVKRFIMERREQGREPSLIEIMNQCGCSKNSAIKYRRELGGSELGGSPDTGEMDVVVVSSSLIEPVTV